MFYLLLLQLQFNLEIHAKVKHQDAVDLKSKRNRKRFTAMMLVCAMFAICWIAYIQWETTIASTQSINISMSQYSALDNKRYYDFSSTTTYSTNYCNFKRELKTSNVRWYFNLYEFLPCYKFLRITSISL